MAALVRVEKTEFVSPMFIGEVAHVSAEITYASKHSLEVQVKVIAENILTGEILFHHSQPFCHNPPNSLSMGLKLQQHSPFTSFCHLTLRRRGEKRGMTDIQVLRSIDLRSHKCRHIFGNPLKTTLSHVDLFLFILAHVSIQQHTGNTTYTALVVLLQLHFI